MTSPTPLDRRPPAPNLPSFVQMGLLYADPVGFLERCRRRLGPVFRIRYPGSPPFVFLAEDRLARELYAHDRDAGRAGEAREPFLSPLVGQYSLLCLEDDIWQHQRHLVAQPLHGKRIAGWREQIASIAEAEIDAWPEGRQFALRPRMQAITLEVILRLVFGIEAGDRLERLRSLIPALLDAGSLVFLAPGLRKQLERPGLLRVPGNPVRRFVGLRDEVDEVVYAELRLRRTEDHKRLADRHDLLSMLLLMGDNEGRGMNDEELRDELITLLFAGHETTATALAWSVERLVRHPAVLRRTRDELANGDTAYLDAVIKEALRTRPVVFDTPRLLREPLELGGYRLPAGWLVAPAIPLVHRSPDIFPRPDSFEPERFLTDKTDSPASAWMPFGGGRRRCVGARLALLELQTILSAVIGRCDLRAPRHRDERQRPRGVTLTPAKGACVVVSTKDVRQPTTV